MLVELFGSEFLETNKRDMNSLAEVLGREHILLVAVLQIGDIIIADAGCPVVLAVELDACLRKIDHGDYIGLPLVDGVVLNELVVGDQALERLVKLVDFVARAFLLS